MSGQIIKYEGGEIERQHREVLLSPVMNLDIARSRMKEFQEFVAHYLEPSTDGGGDGGDYGPIPGAGKKKVLLKSGADKLTELYGLYDEYEVDEKEDFESKLFYYKVKCILRSRRDDSIVGTGLGSCSTYESKYRWRDSQRECPKCKNQSIIKGNEQYGGGWVCWAKKGGCGGKFKDGDTAIEGQKIGRVENPDIMDTVNTVLKMAKKRAKIDAVIGVTRSSGIFTQDLEDIPMPPPKPEVPRTAEAIPVPGPAAAVPTKTDFGGEGNTASESSSEIKGASDSPAPETTDATATEYIGTGQRRNFHIECRAAVKPARSMDADNLTYQWLLDNGYKNEKGEPTAAMIPAAGWIATRNKAIKWLSAQ